jgi:hypothetical protein
VTGARPLLALPSGFPLLPVVSATVEARGPDAKTLGGCQIQTAMPRRRCP